MIIKRLGIKNPRNDMLAPISLQDEIKKYTHFSVGPAELGQQSRYLN